MYFPNICLRYFPSSERNLWKYSDSYFIGHSIALMTNRINKFAFIEKGNISKTMKKY